MLKEIPTVEADCDEAEWLTSDEAAAEARKHGRKCCTGYLGKLRSEGRGPQFYLRGHRIAYRRSDVIAWVTESLPIRGPFLKASEVAALRNLAAAAA
jgi:hypothetical protein